MSHIGEKKSSLIQAAILGRVERLLGSSSDVNPYPKGTELWTAFKNGWSRDLDNPISLLLRRSKNLEMNGES